MTTAKFSTPPEYGKELGVDPSKVIVWIRSGELRAVNVATSTTGRPRYKIPLDAICEFESRRSARKPVAAVRRKRRKQETDFVTYF